MHRATSSGSAPQPSSRAKHSSSLPCAASTRTVSADPAANGGLPVRITARTAPRPNTSLRASTLPTAPAACSGGMKAGVPSTLPACVNAWSESRRLDHPRLARRLLRVAVGRRPVRQHFRQAPVHDLHLAEAAHHDVGRLQVAVDDVVRVGVGERLADLLEDGREPAALGRRVGPRLQQPVEGGALDELHGQEGPAVGQRAEVVDRRDGGVLQLAGDAGLVGEAAGGGGVGAVLLLQHLDGDFAAERGVGGAVDDAHAAAARSRRRGRSAPCRPAARRLGCRRVGRRCWSRGRRRSA